MSVVVMGIGNVLWADEGFGVRAIEALHERYAFPAEVRLIEGGTQGVYLLESVKSARRLLIFDAVDFALPPGTLRVFEDDDVPAWGAAKMSLHQSSFEEVLALAKLAGSFPERIVLIGVQPAELGDFGGSLSDPVRARLDEAVRIAEATLRGWGYPAAVRQAALAETERLNAASIALGAYESGRPSAEAACRIGDDRFLALRAQAEQR